ncbi:MAG: hypothetical protein KKA79_08975 [Nanoarchaeota archaeon]|nr:hypothetical protein [Nanoarchaeota archaeon]
MVKDNFLREEYGLKDDAVFKSRSATEEDLELLVNREEEIKKWNKILEDSKKTLNSNFLVFIIGDYGTGKTLSLLRVKKEAKGKNMYPIYLNFKSEEQTTIPGVDFLQRIFKAVNFDDIEVSGNEISKLTDVYPDVGNVFQKILKYRRQPDVFGGMNISQISRLAISFLGGDIVPTQGQLKKLGAIREINKLDIAKEYLIGLLYLLKSSGFSTLVIAADEFEYLFSIVSKSQQSIYLAFLRGIFDLQVNIPKRLRGSTANMALFIAISRDGWMRLEDLEKKERSTGGPITPLKRRVTEMISLEGLSKKDTKSLIEARLHFDRIKGKYVDKPLIPYTVNFVEYIFKLTRGVPADIIVRCDHVLDLGLERRVPRLTAEFAKEVFRKKGLSY